MEQHWWNDYFTSERQPIGYQTENDSSRGVFAVRARVIKHHMEQH